MVKMAVLSAWADIQVASTYQSYLVDVIKPYIARLSPLWLSSLQDFARLRFEPDISSNMTTDVSDSLDIVYAALNRQTLLKVKHTFGCITRSQSADIRFSFTRILGLN